MKKWEEHSSLENEKLLMWNLWNRDSPSPEPSAAPTDPREWTRTSASTTSSREWMSCAGTSGCFKKKRERKLHIKKVQKMCERISGCCAGFPHVDGGLGWAAPRLCASGSAGRAHAPNEPEQGAKRRVRRGDASGARRRCAVRAKPVWHTRDLTVVTWRDYHDIQRRLKVTPFSE